MTRVQARFAVDDEIVEMQNKHVVRSEIQPLFDLRNAIDRGEPKLIADRLVGATALSQDRRRVVLAYVAALLNFDEGTPIDGIGR